MTRTVFTLAAAGFLCSAGAVRANDFNSCREYSIYDHATGSSQPTGFNVTRASAMMNERWAQIQQESLLRAASRPAALGNWYNPYPTGYRYPSLTYPTYPVYHGYSLPRVFNPHWPR
jgi:hypothetical protein